MVICLERGADLHMAQLMPLPLTVSCFSEIQIGFTFLVPAHLGSPGKGPLNGVCVCNISRHFWPHGGYTILVFLHQFNGCFLGEPGSASFSFDCLLSVVLERTFEYEWQFFQLRQCQQSTAGYFETETWTPSWSYPSV